MKTAAEIYYENHGNKYGGGTGGSVDCLNGLFGDTVSGMRNLASTTPGLICDSTDFQ